MLNINLSPKYFYQMAFLLKLNQSEQKSRAQGQPNNLEALPKSTSKWGIVLFYVYFKW